MQGWQIFLFLLVVALAAFFIKTRNRNKPHPPTPDELGAQAQYEADMAQLTALQEQLAASPTGVLQTQINALKNKLGL